MKATLKRVENKAMKDRAFWKALLADPDQALRDNKLELTAADRRRLQRILDLQGRTITIDLATLMSQAIKGSRGDRLFWMGIWTFGAASRAGRVTKTP